MAWGVSVKARDTAVPRTQAGWTVPHVTRWWMFSVGGTRKSHRAAEKTQGEGLAWPPQRVDFLGPPSQSGDGSASSATAFPLSLRCSQGGVNVFVFGLNWGKTQKGTWRFLNFHTRHAVLSNPLR